VIVVVAAGSMHAQMVLTMPLACADKLDKSLHWALHVVVGTTVTPRLMYSSVIVVVKVVRTEVVFVWVDGQT
jgi:hypothetical protein